MFCDDGSALHSYRPVLGNKEDYLIGTIEGSCCPVPDGALLDEHVFAPERCPEGHVATGLRSEEDAEGQVQGSALRHTLRCTRVNETQFTVGEAETIHLTPIPAISLLALVPIRTVTRDQLPPRLRYGLGRTSEISWDLESCTGFPFGAVLQGHGTTGCIGGRFVTLTPRADAVETCPAVANPFSPDARCVTTGVAK